MAPDAPRVFFAFGFDVEVIVREDVRGTQHEIQAGGRSGLLLLPGAAEDGVGDRITAPAGFGNANFYWGSWTSTHGPRGQFGLPSAAFVFEIDPAELAIEADSLPRGFAKGGEQMVEGLRSWLSRFAEHGATVLGQPLSLLDPSPKLLSRPNGSHLTWVVHNGKSSWKDSSSQGITIAMDSSSTPRSERATNLDSFSRVVDLANTVAREDVPAAVALVASARVAAQRRRLRLALMELGTAAEALFTDVLQIGSHKMTLGVLVDYVRPRGIVLPPDVAGRFVEPRNAAVHEGVTPSVAEVDYGLQLMDSLIALHYPDFRYDSGLEVAHRPQRADLLISLPPQDA